MSTPKPERLNLQIMDITGAIPSSQWVCGKVARWSLLKPEQIEVERHDTRLASGREATMYHVRSTTKVSFLRLQVVLAWIEGWQQF